MHNLHKVGKDQKVSTFRISLIGMLSAIGVISVMFVEVPLLPGAPFLKYDPADIPVLIGSITLGPGAGFIITFIVSVLQSLMRGAGGIHGFIMHVAATGSMAVVTGLIYKKSKKNTASTIVSLVSGAIVMVIAMVLLNLVVTPLYLGVPVDEVKAMLVPLIIPFNIIKSGINCIGAFLIIGPIKNIFVSRH